MIDESAGGDLKNKYFNPMIFRFATDANLFAGSGGEFNQNGG
jgi:hypothetical protein